MFATKRAAITAAKRWLRGYVTATVYKGQPGAEPVARFVFGIGPIPM